jgi:DNA adenine methylase
MPEPTRPALRYHGGKWRIAPWIIEHFPPHHVYVEPFGGAASVLLRKPRAFGEVYNDLDSEVVNVFRVLRDPASAAELERVLRLTPFAREEYETAYEPTDDLLERARRTIIKAFMGFGSDAIHRSGPRGMRLTLSTNRAGAAPTGFRPMARPNGASPAKDFASWPAMIGHFTARLAGVAIENRPALEVVEQFDRHDTLFYLDPPYVRSTRRTADRNGYAHEMKDDDHRELAERLHRSEAMIVISGYPSELYDDELYPGWQRVTRTAYADAKKRQRTEVLWLNERATGAQSQQVLPFLP